MALSSDLPVYKASYDLLLAIYQMVKHFAREYKYKLGENLKNQAVELLNMIYRANSRHDKVETIQSVRKHLEVIIKSLPGFCLSPSISNKAFSCA